MRIAIIDCGTNTFNLLIAELSDGKWTKIFSTKVPVRIGKGGITKNIIQPDRFARAIDGLTSHYFNTLNYQVEETYIFGTAAIREATNKEALKSLIKKKFNWDLAIIDGQKEAFYIYQGVKQTVDFGREPYAIIDIGGGSTELIVCNNDEILWSTSTDLGVSRLYDQIEPNDPISKQDLSVLNKKVVNDTFEFLKAITEHRCSILVGSSGSFDSLIKMTRSRSQSEEPISNLSNEFNQGELEQLHKELVISSKGERLKMSELHPMRVDFIVLASQMIQTIIEEGKFKRIFHSNYALKEGIIRSIIQSPDDWNNN